MLIFSFLASLINYSITKESPTFSACGANQKIIRLINTYQILIAHLGHISGCLHELGKLLVADLVRVHTEGVECDSTCRTLAVLGMGGLS